MDFLFVIILFIICFKINFQLYVYPKVIISCAVV